jgi:hypothetical protein
MSASAPGAEVALEWIPRVEAPVSVAEFALQAPARPGQLQ